MPQRENPVSAAKGDRHFLDQFTIDSGGFHLRHPGQPKLDRQALQ
jgi:hypothetical protein